MTIRRLTQPDAARSAPIDPAPSATAIAFAFDAAYLAAFAVMIHSMLRTGSMLDSPVYVYSDDPEVFEDPLVRSVADRSVLVEGPELEQLARLAEQNIKRPERAKWNRGTCLKWMVFDDAPVDQVLFLDVDMLCLRPIGGFATLHPGADLVCCPQFQRAMMPEPDAPGAAELSRDRLLDTLARREGFGRRINSGVMLVRKRLLRREFRDRLIAFAGGRLDINEQSHLTAFFQDREANAGARRAFASSAYNFQENYLEAIDPVDALRILQKVRILHYAGSPKPWLPKAAKADRFSLKLWRQFQKSATRSTSRDG